ncbi:MAG: glutamine--fructose-6-phosphate aminotransferase, partial [Candidatus Cloacimonetes bacterium]|nr:glutamine--fructose-6-phosphate aminotransferase [Candidatus Cloacimonadota bacterium]
MNLDKIRKFRLVLPVPIPALGCGVLGLSLARKSINIGKYASTLLKALEYRGYDSTGAVFQDERKKITLLKDVGAPSTLVKTLGIEEQAGKIFCGQVRWATFGTVSRKNAQPHEVKCKKHIYGAHNGNLTNTRELRKFLLSEGHNVVSDNDGEMLVHTIEHYFDNELEKFPDSKHLQTGTRQAAMRRAIIQAADKIIGSYAAVIIDPVTEFCYAIKAGSSLYFGLGEIENNKFGLASSDLTALLKFTKHLVNLREGEFIEFKQDKYQIYAFRILKVKVPNQQDVIFQPGDQISKLPVYSRLRAEDTELVPPFKYFMEQEIMAEIETSGKLIKLFQGGSNTGKRMLNVMQQENILGSISSLCEQIQECSSPDMQKRYFSDFLNSQEADQIFGKVKENYEAIYNELVK